MTAAIALLAGLGNGYVRGKMNADDDARRDRAEKREDERHAFAVRQAEAQEAERRRVATDRDALRAAATPVTVQQAVDLPDNRDIGQPGETAPTPFYRAGAQRFAEQAGADQYAATANTPEGTQGRILAELNRQDPMRAQEFQQRQLQTEAAQLQLKQATESAIKEGTLDALGRAMEGESPEQVMAAFNKNGKTKIKDLKIENFEVDHPVLGKQKDARVMATLEDGTQMRIDSAFGASLRLFGAAKRFDLLGDWKRTEQAQSNADRTFNQQKTNDDRTYDLRKTDADRDYSLAQTRLGIDRERLGMDRVRHKAAMDQVLADAKVPQPVKDQVSMYRERLKIIDSAIAKAQADNTFDPASPGAQALMTQQRSFTDLATKLMAPYVDKATGGKAADPLGLDATPKDAPKGKAATAAGAAGAPAAKSDGPSVVQQTMRAGASAVDMARQQGSQYESIDRRVRQAMSGGAPLTPEEVAAARQFGISVPRR